MGAAEHGVAADSPPSPSLGPLASLARLAAERPTVRQQAAPVKAPTHAPRFPVAAILALIPSTILLWQGVVDRSFTDVQVAAGAPEDLLGFGLWTLLVPLSFIAAFMLLWVWRLASPGIRRGIAAAETALFVAAALLATWSYTLLKARVFR